MNPQNPQKPNKQAQKKQGFNFGDPLDLDELLNFASIDVGDIESAAQWWDDTASREWVGALDSEPTNDNS